jgi:WD40 repeat protein
MMNPAVISPVKSSTAPFTSVKWLADKNQIVTYLFDNSVKFWDAQTGANTFTLSGHNAAVTSLNWSPDGKRIVTSSTDKTAKVWDAATGAELYTLAGHTDAVNEADWLADGQLILTISADGTVKVWRAWASTQDLIDYAQECCVVRDLTGDERTQFGLPAAP